MNPNQQRRALVCIGKVDIETEDFVADRGKYDVRVIRLRRPSPQ